MTPLRVVVDTNVWVSAALTPAGVPGQVLRAVREGLFIPLFDARVLAEYQEVLRRPKFRLPTVFVTDLLSTVTETGDPVAAEPLSFALPDPDDAPFLEVALSGSADVLVTGNVRDFEGAPASLVMSPRDFLNRLRGGH